MLSRRHFLAMAPALAAIGCSPARTESASRRSVTQVIDAMDTRDGAGVSLARSIGSQALPNLDPFLLLDQIRSEHADDYIAGFPDHPHRGFETVTYMIEGAMDHRDILGNHGHLVSGSVQWMTAGRGIVHSEMPKQERGLLFGFQLWVNLPARLKMTEPRYQDIAPADVPELGVDGANVRLLAGELQRTRGPVRDIFTAPTMLDVALPARGRFEKELPRAHTAFVYVLDGEIEIGQERLHPRQLGVLGRGEELAVRSTSRSRFLLLAAQAIGEPIARRGPFVMNTEAELQQAFDDYRSGRLVGG